jgi:SAM-dependent methyltransferase
MTRDFWELAARVDPLWAILSDPSKKGGKWTAAEFFETGRREVALLMYQLHVLGQYPVCRRAMDFGCGVGRLSQALSAFFPEVVGIDVSRRMIELAERANMARSRVRYVLNETEDLGQFPSRSFDFIYSDIVLQHLSPELSERFIQEFVRLLAPHGILVFQLASHLREPAERQPQTVPLPPEAYRARLQVDADLPSVLTPNELIPVSVHVENVSAWNWDQAHVGAIRVGNHWLSPTGVMMIQDDGRANLPQRISVGNRATVIVPIRAPEQDGTYVVEFDLVHEGVTWFADRGSVAVRREIRVFGGDRDRVDPLRSSMPDVRWPEVPDATDLGLDGSYDAEPEIGPFPMHGVFRDDVLAMLDGCGAPAFHVESDDRAGPEWYGYRYFAQRSS